MSESDAAVSGLGPEHYRAICDEIGERLRYSLPPTTSGLPVRIAELLARLAEQDHDAPSIVPCLEEVVRVNGLLRRHETKAAATVLPENAATISQRIG